MRTITASKAAAEIGQPLSFVNEYMIGDRLLVGEEFLVVIKDKAMNQFIANIALAEPAQVTVNYDDIGKDDARYTAQPAITPEERTRASQMGITTKVYMKEKATGAKLDKRGLLHSIERAKTTAHHNENFKQSVPGEVDYS